MALKFRELLPITGIHSGGISYHSLSDGSPYVLLLCANGALIRYNIKKDKLKKLTTISKQLILSHSIRNHFTLDINNNIVYFCDDFFAIYEIQTNKWDIKCRNISFDNENANKLNYDRIGSIKSVQYIPNPVNELHLICNGKHIKYDKATNKFIQFQHSNVPQYAVRHMVYMQKMKLLVLLLWNLEIWSCKITAKNQTKFVWEESELMLPISYASHDNFVCPPMIAFDNIIVIFISIFNTADIWFLDMITNKRYKSDKIYWLQAQNLTTVVKDDEDVLHCIGSGFYHRMFLTDILPTFQRNKIIVYGFIRRVEDENDLYQQVPTSLNQLILAFFPSNL